MHGRAMDYMAIDYIALQIRVSDGNASTHRGGGSQGALVVDAEVAHVGVEGGVVGVHLQLRPGHGRDLRVCVVHQRPARQALLQGLEQLLKHLVVADLVRRSRVHSLPRPAACGLWSAQCTSHRDSGHGMAVQQVKAPNWKHLAEQ